VCFRCTVRKDCVLLYVGAVVDMVRVDMVRVDMVRVDMVRVNAGLFGGLRARLQMYSQEGFRCTDKKVFYMYFRCNVSGDCVWL